MGCGINTLRRFAFISLFALVCSTAAVATVWHFRTAAEISPDERLTCEGEVRSYRLVVPHSLSQPAPIVFAFHGVGGSGEGMARYSKFDRLAGKEGFLLVYPAAQKGMWATMETVERPLEDNPDIQFFDQLLDHLDKRFDIDRNRVYVVGMSNGASFVQLLMIARPSVIAAAAAHSGPQAVRVRTSRQKTAAVVADRRRRRFRLLRHARRRGRIPRRRRRRGVDFHPRHGPSMVCGSQSEHLEFSFAVREAHCTVRRQIDTGRTCYRP